MSKIQYDMVHNKVSLLKNRFACTDSVAFGCLILSDILCLVEDDPLDTITDGPSDNGIDGVHIDEQDGEAHIHLFQFKYFQEQNCNKKPVEAKELGNIVTYINLLFEKNISIQKSFNQILWDKTQEIWEWLSRPKTKITIHICSNGIPIESIEMEKFKNALKQYNVIEVKEIVFKDVVSVLTNVKKSNTNVEIQAVDRQVFHRDDVEIRGLITNVYASSFLKIITDSATGELDTNLFDLNIRCYLSSDTSVNKDIINSALSNDRHLFWYLNNGITAVCDEFNFNPSAPSPIINIKGLQIVNGAQTSGALFAANKIDTDKVKDIVVLLKLFQTKDNKLPEKVAVATNSQNRIGSRDLMANTAILKQLEASFLTKGYFFERKRLQHEMAPSEKRIDAHKLGQIIWAYILKEPERCKTTSDQIFGRKFEDIFISNLDVNLLINVFNLYLLTEEKKQHIAQKRRSGMVGRGEEFIVYGQFHLLYLCSILAEKGKVDISDAMERKKLVDQSICILLEYAEVKKKAAPYSLFRSHKTNEELLSVAILNKQLAFEFQEDLVQKTSQAA